MDEIQWQQHDLLRVRYRPRPEYRGRPLRDGEAELAGVEAVVSVGWWMADDEAYPGEAAFCRIRAADDEPGKLFSRRPDGGVRGWVASGDCEVLERLRWADLPKE